MRMELAEGPVDFVSTVSSDGKINIHDLTRVAMTLSVEASDDDETPPVATYDTKGSRLVCCCTAEVFRGKSQPQVKTEVKDEAGAAKEEEGSVDGGDDFYGQAGDDESEPEQEENVEDEQEVEDEYEMEDE
jgi:protein MAK11